MRGLSPVSDSPNMNINFDGFSWIFEGSSLSVNCV